MTDALAYLVDSLLTIYLYILVLRFVMQLTRADFRNQIAVFVTTVTNPLIMPLRRILPPLGKIDTASVVAILLLIALDIVAIALIVGSPIPPPVPFAIALLYTLLRTFLLFFLGAIIIYAILSFVVPGGYSPPMALLGTVVEPLLAPFRRIIPPIANIDLSPLWASLLLGVLLRLLPHLFAFTNT
jgi:YggT family protein